MIIEVKILDETMKYLKVDRKDREVCVGSILFIEEES